MQAQLQEIIADFEAASARLRALQARLSPERWLVRADAAGWSAAECVDHLNRTSEIFLPVVRERLAAAPPLTGARRYRRDPMGWFLWRIMPPPVRIMRVRTKPRFMPTEVPNVSALCARFDALQQEQIACVQQADGLAIDRVVMVSPVDGRAKYNLFACLGILPRHQHRHLWQAERVAAVVGA